MPSAPCGPELGSIPDTGTAPGPEGEPRGCDDAVKGVGLPDLNGNAPGGAWSGEVGSADNGGSPSAPELPIVMCSLGKGGGGV